MSSIRFCCLRSLIIKYSSDGEGKWNIKIWALNRLWLFRLFIFFTFSKGHHEMFKYLRLLSEMPDVLGIFHRPLEASILIQIQKHKNCPHRQLGNSSNSRIFYSEDNKFHEIRKTRTCHIFLISDCVKMGLKKTRNWRKCWMFQLSHFNSNTLDCLLEFERE